jgi:hypothetical protein
VILFHQRGISLNQARSKSSIHRYPKCELSNKSLCMRWNDIEAFVQWSRGERFSIEPSMEQSKQRHCRHTSVVVVINKEKLQTCVRSGICEQKETADMRP